MNWESLLSEEIEKPYFLTLAANVKSRGLFYPHRDKMFRALELVEFKEIRIVILGQDPYHGEGQANGLAFSVSSDQKLPPSLRNIFSEIKSDLDIQNTNGDLTSWANQGVLLLNSIMTVFPDEPGSHANLGWETFTNKIISDISTHLNHVVFMLWGAYAKSKENLIDNTRHCVLTSSHPSPLSAHTGFFGCKHFSRANQYLSLNGRRTIDWRT